MRNPLFGFKAHNKPKNLMSAAPLFYFDTSGAGKSINPQNAIQVSAVYACVRVIAETIASLLLPVAGSG